MHTAPENKLADLRQKLKKAEHWAFTAESDGEYESARQLIIWLEFKISELTEKAAA